MTSLRELGDTVDARDALHHRLQSIVTRSAALIRAGTDLANLLTPARIREPGCVGDRTRW